MRPALLSGVLAALARSDGPRLAAVLLGAARGAIGDAATAVSAGWTHSCGIYRMFFVPREVGGWVLVFQIWEGPFSVVLQEA